LLDDLATQRFGKRKEEQKMSEETAPVENNDDSVPDVAPEEVQGEGWVPQSEAQPTDGTLADETTPAEASPEEAAPDKTIDELAIEVLEGKWGVGQERRLALGRAGYDRQAVQARVNQMLAERRA